MVGADTTLLVHLEIKEAPEHLRAHEWLRREILEPADSIALAPQVLMEFVHIVTDSKRFQNPLTGKVFFARQRGTAPDHKAFAFIQFA